MTSYHQVSFVTYNLRNNIVIVLDDTREVEVLCRLGFSAVAQLLIAPKYKWNKLFLVAL